MVFLRKLARHIFRSIAPFCMWLSTLLLMGADEIMPLPAEYASSARYLSYSIRDTPASINEVESAKSPEDLRILVDQWTKSEAYLSRIFRLFNDLIGVYEGTWHTGSHLWLKTNNEGIFFLEEKGDCTSQDAQEVKTWWGEEGEKSLVCKNTISSLLSFPKDSWTLVCPSQGGSWGMGDPRCGCGPLMIGCFPYKYLTRLNEELVREIGYRGLNVVEQNGSWMDFLGGNYVYGTRLLYWRYLFASGISTRGVLPSSETLVELLSLPLNKKERVPFPPSKIPRAGVISALGFMHQYPNFRSRTRMLVETFLCRKIDSTLNTHNLSTYLNKDMGKTEIKHATRPDCAACHYGLDNLATMILGFSGTGSVDPTKKLSTLGSAFGKKDEGAEGFARSIIQHSPWFHPCMAKRFWESITGEDFDALSAEEKASLIAQSQKGPQPLLDGIIMGDPLYSLRPVQKVTTYAEIAPTVQTMTETHVTTSTAQISFAAIQPILEKNCGASKCHGKGSSLGDFVTSEDSVKNSFATIKERIQLEGGGKMPPGQLTLPQEDKNQLLQYLDQWEFE